MVISALANEAIIKNLPDEWLMSLHLTVLMIELQKRKPLKVQTAYATGGRIVCNKEIISVSSELLSYRSAANTE